MPFSTATEEALLVRLMFWLVVSMNGFALCFRLVSLAGHWHLLLDCTSFNCLTPPAAGEGKGVGRRAGGFGVGARLDSGLGWKTKIKIYYSAK